MRMIISITLLLAIFVLGCSTIETNNVIDSFDDCINAGNPAMESHPRQCRDSESGKTFVEVIQYPWQLDGIVLMQHTTKGYYDCFGCSTSKEGPALCVDPILEMKKVNETLKIHCNSEFEVVNN